MDFHSRNPTVAVGLAVSDVVNYYELNCTGFFFFYLMFRCVENRPYISACVLILAAYFTSMNNVSVQKLFVLIVISD